MKNTVNKYFEVKVKMQKTQEDGTQKKVSEQYVVEAATFGEAERRITECLKPYIVQIINTNQDADKFFKAKVSFVTLDETTGKEKKTSELYLVQSDTLESAESDVKSFLNDGNTAISSISETVILDVFQLD